MKEEALEYYDKFMFNITRMHSVRNEFNKDKNQYKHPGHNWEHIISERQNRKELEEEEWSNVIGIGAVLGYNNLRALDIDDCTRIEFIAEILETFRLPNDYPWVVRSGSQNGFHILLYNNDDFEKIASSEQFVYNSKEEYKEIFRKIEFRWKKQIVLPPSMHETMQNYSFLFGKPASQPLYVETNYIRRLFYDYFDKKYYNGMDPLHQLGAILCKPKGDWEIDEKSKAYALEFEEAIDNGNMNKIFKMIGIIDPSSSSSSSEEEYQRVRRSFDSESEDCFAGDGDYENGDSEWYHLEGGCGEGCTCDECDNVGCQSHPLN